MLDFTTYVRKPFKVEATVVTKDNIAEIAEKIGRLKYRQHGEPYIQVDLKKLPGIPFVYLGFFMTQMGSNIRCYSPRKFEEQFVPNSGDIQKWIDFLNRGYHHNNSNSNTNTMEASEESNVVT